MSGENASFVTVGAWRRTGSRGIVTDLFISGGLISAGEWWRSPRAPETARTAAYSWRRHAGIARWSQSFL